MESAVRKSLGELAKNMERDFKQTHEFDAEESASELHAVLAANNRKLHAFSLDHLDDAAQIEVEYRFPFNAEGFAKTVDRLTALFGAPSHSLETVLTFERENSRVRSLIKSTGEIQLDSKTKLVDCVVGSVVIDGRRVSKTWCASLEEPVEDDQITRASEVWFAQNNSASVEGAVTFPLDAVTGVEGSATQEELAHSWGRLRFLSIGRKPTRQFINLPAAISLEKEGDASGEGSGGASAAPRRHLALGDVTVTVQASCKPTTRAVPALQPVGVKRRKRLTFTTDGFHVDCTQFKVQGGNKTMFNVEIEFDLKCARAAGSKTTPAGSLQVPEMLEFLL